MAFSFEKLDEIDCFKYHFHNSFISEENGCNKIVKTYRSRRNDQKYVSQNKATG